MSQEAKDLLSKMLARNPAVRITAYEVMQHPWTVGKILNNEPQNPANVLEMMRLWKSEIKVLRMRLIIVANLTINIRLQPVKTGWQRRTCPENALQTLSKWLLPKCKHRRQF